MPAPSTFAEFFERLRLGRGWTPAEVARRLDVYPTEVSRWRRGRGGISIRNVRKVADLFGVDRAELERLAGYGDSPVSVSKDTLNPEIAAMYDADRAAVEGELSGIPPAFFPAIFNAQRTARRLAVEVARAAIELTQPKAPISLPASSELATSPRRLRRDRLGGDGPKSGPLASVFALAGAH